MSCTSPFATTTTTATIAADLLKTAMANPGCMRGTFSPLSAVLRFPASQVRHPNDSHTDAPSGYDWFDFLTKAGVESHRCEGYTQSFIKSSMDMDANTLPGITPGILRTFGLSEDDNFRVMRYLNAILGQTGTKCRETDGEVASNVDYSGPSGPGSVLRDETVPAIQAPTSGVESNRGFRDAHPADPDKKTEGSQRGTEPTSQEPVTKAHVQKTELKPKSLHEPETAAQTTKAPPAIPLYDEPHLGLSVSTHTPGDQPSFSGVALPPLLVRGELYPSLSSSNMSMYPSQYLVGRGQGLDNNKGTGTPGAEDGRGHSLQCESIMGQFQGSQKQLVSPRLELAEQFFAGTSDNARGSGGMISTVGASINTGGGERSTTTSPAASPSDIPNSSASHLPMHPDAFDRLTFKIMLSRFPMCCITKAVKVHDPGAPGPVPKQELDLLVKAFRLGGITWTTDAEKESLVLELFEKQLYRAISRYG